MARGKIYTNRKKTVRLGNEKHKQSSKSKKDKKSTEQKQEKKPVATDVFDFRTGVVYSIRPEDTDVQLMEAKVTSYLKEKGAIEDPKEYLTTAVHLGDPILQALPSGQLSPPPSLKPKPVKAKMEKAEVPVTFWQEVKDAKSSNTYYWNPETNATSWTLPENAVITSEASERSDKITDPENEEVPDLVKAYNHCAKTLFGVETDEVKGNGVSQTGEEAPIDATCVSGNAVSKKGKQKSSEDIPQAGILSPDMSSNISQKNKLRSSKGSGAATNSPAVRKAESPLLKLQVSNLSDEIFRKLEYLHVSREKITELQKLQIQLETRMEDWKEEEISSKYFVAKLKSASDRVNTFVQDEVPSGWTCVWDRASCRYYFNNEASGEVSWEFPVASADSVSSSQESTDEREVENEVNEQQEHKMVVSSLPAPPGPPPLADPAPTISQVTSPPVVMLEQSLVSPAGVNEAAVPEPKQNVTDDPADVEMKEDNDKSVEAIEPTKVEPAKADTPPVQLYDDIGPLTNQSDSVTTLPVADDCAEENEKQEESPVINELQESAEKDTEIDNQLTSSKDRKDPETEEGEVGNSGDEKNLPESFSYSKKQKKRSRYYSDSDDSYDSRRKSSSKKSRRHRGDPDSDYSDHSDDRYSKRRRSRSHSKDRGYDRSDSEEHYYRKSRSSYSKYGRDGSDNEQHSRRSSRKQRSRSRSRDHGSRELPYRKDSKKKKKEKRKHRHRDSSSGDDYYSRKSKSKTKEREYDFSGNKTNRDSTLPKEQPPPVEKKAFVPAKFKPKGKAREDMDDSGLSATQLEMMQNIANVTSGAYMMNTAYPMVSDPQYAAYYASGSVAATGYDPVPPPATSLPPQPPAEIQLPTTTATVATPIAPPPVDNSTEATVSQVQAPSLKEKANKAEDVAVVDHQGIDTTTSINESSQQQVATDDSVSKTTAAAVSEDITECEMELDDNDGDGGNVSQESGSGVIDMIAQESNAVMKSANEMKSDDSSAVVPGDVKQATESVVPETEESKPAADTPKVEAAATTAATTTTTATTSTLATPTTQQDNSGDTTPPAQDTSSTSQSYTISASSTTYSNPPTSYAATYDPSQQAAYAAYAQQQYYGNPYQYYTDPAQYAAAMNYYAAYQAAYTGTYNAYYQQQAQQVTPGAPNPPGGGAAGGASQK